MTQLTFEDEARDHGMAFAAQGHEDEISRARDMAVYLLTHGLEEITIDNLRKALPGVVWKNWSGSVFKDPRFICSGFSQSTHKGGHRRIVRKWRLR